MLVRRPVVEWIHNDWREFSRFVSWPTRYALQMYRLANYIVAVSSGAHDGIKAIAGVPEAGVETIYNGIDLTQVRALPQADLPEGQKSWFEGPTIVAVGRLGHQKD
jgi:glycosyltransferase involved in cell wall biosynthesis